MPGQEEGGADHIPGAEEHAVASNNLIAVNKNRNIFDSKKMRIVCNVEIKFMIILNVYY